MRTVYLKDIVHNFVYLYFADKKYIKKNEQKKKLKIKLVKKNENSYRIGRISRNLNWNLSKKI